MVSDYEMAKILRVAAASYLILVDAPKGMHSFTEQKAVNVSFIVDDIKGWFAYAQKHRPFELRSEKLEVGEGDKYHAFIGYDPEGYYMEFDKFYEHSLNVKLLAYLMH